MNYQITAISIVGIICTTALAGFGLFVNWQTDTERCTVTTEMQPICRGLPDMREIIELRTCIYQQRS